jgi:hypothetical protein
MTAFWNNTELSQIHIELTNACNAACPMCVRFYHNSPLVRPDLEIGQITLDKFKQYFPEDVVKQCNMFLLCGVHGDPGMAKDLYEICEYIQSIDSNTIVHINTNGGMRNSDWWYKFGQLFSNRSTASSRWRVVFSIDGLEDTNHIYRRNVKWKTLENNFTAFIKGGGIAVWEYLIFKHNEHQLEEAEAYSKQVGFSMFIPKKALGVDDGTHLRPMPVMSREGVLEYSIEAPTIAKYRNLESPVASMPVRYGMEISVYNKLKNKELDPGYDTKIEHVYDQIAIEDHTKANTCSIQCKAKRNTGKEIFVDNFGRLMPCCYVGTHLNGIYKDTKSLQLHKHMKDYGWDNFDLNKHTLRDIIDAGHLDNVFAKSWDIDTVANGRLAYCASICGEESKIDRIYSLNKIDGKSIYKKAE